MPTEATLVSTSIWAGNPAVAIGRIVGPDGGYLEQADIDPTDKVAWSVYDMDNSDTVTGSGTLAASSCIYDELQTDRIWTKDATGYNFKATLAGSCFPQSSRRYRAVFTFHLTSGNDIIQPFQIFTMDPTG